MYGGLIGTHQRSFKWYHPRPPMASPSSRLGVCNLATLLSQEQVKLRTSNLAATFTGPIRIKSHYKFWRKGCVNVSRDYPIFGGTHYWLLSQERVKLRTSNFVGTFIESIGTKAMKNVGNSSHGVVRESRKFSRHPCIGRFARSSLR